MDQGSVWVNTHCITWSAVMPCRLGSALGNGNSVRNVQLTSSPGGSASSITYPSAGAPVKKVSSVTGPKANGTPEGESQLIVTVMTAHRSPTGGSPERSTGGCCEHADGTRVRSPLRPRGSVDAVFRRRTSVVRLSPGEIGVATPPICPNLLISLHSATPPAGATAHGSSSGVPSTTLVSSNPKDSGPAVSTSLLVLVILATNWPRVPVIPSAKRAIAPRLESHRSGESRRRLPSAC